jgi:hypothetical protein
VATKSKYKATQIDYDTVDLIRRDADRYGLLWEVEATAVKYIKEDPSLNISHAYSIAFQEWVK